MEAVLTSSIAEASGGLKKESVSRVGQRLQRARGDKCWGVPLVRGRLVYFLLILKHKLWPKSGVVSPVSGSCVTREWRLCHQWVALVPQVMKLTLDTLDNNSLLFVIQRDHTIYSFWMSYFVPMRLSVSLCTPPNRANVNMKNPVHSVQWTLMRMLPHVCWGNKCEHFLEKLYLIVQF